MSHSAMLPPLALRVVRRSFAVGLTLSIAACEAVDRQTGEAAKQDTTTLPATASGTAAGEARLRDTAGDTSGVPAVPDASDTSAAAGDSGIVTTTPSTPTRGSLVFAHAEGIAAADPRCTWKGERIPCQRRGTGVMALVPVGLEDPAGRYSLVFERPGGRVVREITVAGRELPRELVFVSDTLYRLLGRRADIARDARVLRRVLSAPPSGTADTSRSWSAAWRAPVQGTPGGFGEERFFYPATDSGRSIRLDPGLRTAGIFGVDTARAGRDVVPGWRWGGVDYDARRGTAVVAPAAGTVAEVGDYTLTGRTLVLDHGRGALSTYYHLDTVLVRKGDELPAGRTIGRVGSTGLTPRPRLHYAVFVHGQPVDPRGLREIPPFAR